MEEEGTSLGSFQLATSPPTPPFPMMLLDEMVFEFLLRLPIKNLHQCNCVSKAWQSIISNPGFIQAYKNLHPDVGLLISIPNYNKASKTNHFYYSTLRVHEPDQFVSRFQVPCPDYNCSEVTEVIHGLVCFYGRNCLFVCNIFTRDVLPLPTSVPNSNQVRKYFFGFDIVNGVYKLLSINLHSSRWQVCEIEILTLDPSSGCGWRNVSVEVENGGRRILLPSEIATEVRSFCVYGVMYWMVVRKKSRRRSRCYLVSFDLNKEKLRYIKLPQGLTSRCLLSHCFVKFRGRLALSVPSYTGGYRLSLYVLEDDEGNLWTKHSIALPKGLNLWYGMGTIPVGNLPDGQMLLANPLVEESFTPVYSYDHQTGKFERLFVGKFPQDLRNIVEYGVVNISCLEENLTPFDVLFDGAKWT